jgi:hypothetical protein
MEASVSETKLNITLKEEDPVVVLEHEKPVFQKSTHSQ